MNTKTYIVKEDGWVAGQRRAKGDPVELTEAQAKYEDNIELEEGGSPNGNSTGLAAKAAEEQKKRGGAKK